MTFLSGTHRPKSVAWIDRNPQVPSANYFTQWYKDTTRILWRSVDRSVFLRNMSTGNDEMVFDACANHWILPTDVHPTENKILGIQAIITFGEDYYKHSSSVIEYDLDTEEIKVILE